MNPVTFIIDFVPKPAKETPSALRNKNYALDLIDSRDLGEVIICTSDNYKEMLLVHNPFIIITTSEWDARQIKEHKSDAMLYVTPAVTSVFSKKAETEEKMEKQRKLFDEVERIVKKVRESDDAERESMRRFSAMSYDDMYKMIQKAIISDDENLRKKAWDLLWGEGEKHSNFIWMRVQMMAEMWDHADWKVREDLMCMSMERHLDLGTARKMDNFTDEDGLEYHQYMFLDPFGKDLNHIRRLPFATKGQDKYSYENLLEKNEIPTNYLRVQLEATSLRKQWDDYIASECVKVKRVLEDWKNDPNKSKKDLGVAPWNENDDVNDPLTEHELNSLKKFLEKYQDTDSVPVSDD